MIALQESDVNGVNSGSFQDIFNATAAEIGSTGSGKLSVEDAEASRDEAKALEDEGPVFLLMRSCFINSVSTSIFCKCQDHSNSP